MTGFDCNKFCDRAISLFGNTGQVELSQKIGVAKGGISSRKRKEAIYPASDTVFRIAKHFNVSLDWLLGLTDNKITDEFTTEGGRNMNLNTKCNCCMCESVCKYKYDYQEGVESILNTTLTLCDNTVTKLKDYPHIEVSIRCPHMVTRGGIIKGHIE